MERNCFKNYLPTTRRWKEFSLRGRLTLKRKRNFLRWESVTLSRNLSCSMNCRLSSERCWTVNEYPLCVHRQYLPKRDGLCYSEENAFRQRHAAFNSCRLCRNRSVG